MKKERQLSHNGLPLSHNGETLSIGDKVTLLKITSRSTHESHEDVRRYMIMNVQINGMKDIMFEKVISKRIIF